MLLRNWQIDRIDAREGMFDGCATYLVKINYELELELASPPMPWFEIAFDFLSGDEEADSVVIDALPISATSVDGPTAYVLNRFLNFMPTEDGASAHALLLASRDRIDRFGTGSQGVRWRHVSPDGAGVLPGSYAAWVALQVPAGRSEQRVEFSARYDLDLGAVGISGRPAQAPTEFHLGLSGPAEAPRAVAPSLSAAQSGRSVVDHPSAFICYAHDSDRHKEYAREFGNLLVRNGVDAHMDQWDDDRRKDWGAWSRALIGNVDYVIVLASSVCRRAFDKELTGPDHPGIRSEAVFINEFLHSKREQWTPKVLPVVLPHEVVEHIPDALLPWTTDHYEVEQLTSEGIEGLLRAMTGVPRHTRPPLGKLPSSVVEPLGDAGPGDRTG
ncbi:SEFIR domain-containing protein [Kitasatospora sp. SC0581]|uniref:SEFIR domain-containing protein n=1 Tax=Kitasatospora sp. SC0581 TaxID=3394360 RepID=UPI003A8BC2E6